LFPLARPGLLSTDVEDYGRLVRRFHQVCFVCSCNFRTTLYQFCRTISVPLRIIFAQFPYSVRTSYNFCTTSIQFVYNFRTMLVPRPTIVVPLCTIFIPHRISFIRNKHGMEIVRSVASM